MASLVEKIDHIFLIGFMGCGKSTIGRLLAKFVGWHFIDLDDEIVQHERMSIEQIFDTRGEPYFRQLEIELLKTIRQRNKIIVALGGGTPTSEAAWLILETGLTIYLRCHPEELYRRLKDENNRPLLNRIPPGKRLTFIKDLLTVREPFYLRAESIVDCYEQHSAYETAMIISHLIKDRI